MLDAFLHILNLLRFFNGLHNWEKRNVAIINNDIASPRSEVQYFASVMSVNGNNESCTVYESDFSSEDDEEI